MEREFSKQIHTILKYSRLEALRLRCDFINTEHILLGLLKENSDNIVHQILYRLNCDPDELIKQIENVIKPLPYEIDLENVPLTKRAEDVLKHAWIEAGRSDALSIKPEHLFLALLLDNGGVAADVFKSRDITYTKAKNQLLSIHQNSEQSTELSALKSYGTDLTELANKNLLDPVIGRDREIDRIIRILCRKKKNNPLIIGEPGIGKTAIVEGIAIQIAKKNVPFILRHSKIFNLDISSLIAGTALRGQLEERLKLLANTLIGMNNVILFIDEIHTIIEAGKNGNSMSLANLLKPLLTDGMLKVIGATTIDDYRKYFEKDRALSRRFQNVLAHPPTSQETLKILIGLKDKYETYHNVRYTKAAVRASLQLSERFLSDRYFPDKAIDLLDEAGALAKFKQFNLIAPDKMSEEIFSSTPEAKVFFQKIEQLEHKNSNRESDLEPIYSTENPVPWVTVNEVAHTLHSMTGISTSRITQSEAEKYLSIENKLQEKIIGQNEAIRTISNSLRRARVGLRDNNKPIGSFLFVGPSGVGKTKLAMELANLLFEGKEAYCQFNMSEFMEKLSVSRLIGAPPGYVGYENGGELTEKIKRHPYSVVVFEDIDKAHPEVINIFLQLLDDGMLTDSIGRKISFRNTIVILTVNSENVITNRIGFDTHSLFLNDYDDYLKKTFSPEFLNRIDEIVQFDQFSNADTRTMFDLELKSLTNRLEENQIYIHLSPRVLPYLLKISSQMKIDGRLIKSLIRRYIEDAIALKIISKEFKHGDTFYIDELNENLDIQVQASG